MIDSCSTIDSSNATQQFSLELLHETLASHGDELHAAVLCSLSSHEAAAAAAQTQTQTQTQALAHARQSASRELQRTQRDLCRAQEQVVRVQRELRERNSQSQEADERVAVIEKRVIGAQRECSLLRDERDKLHAELALRDSESNSVRDAPLSPFSLSWMLVTPRLCSVGLTRAVGRALFSALCSLLSLAGRSYDTSRICSEIRFSCYGYGRRRDCI